MGNLREPSGVLGKMRECWGLLNYPPLQPPDCAEHELRKAGRSRLRVRRRLQGALYVVACGSLYKFGIV